MTKRWKLIFSYFLSFILVITFYLGLSETYVSIYKWIKPDSNITVFSVSQLIGLAITVILATIGMSRVIRSNPDVVSIGTTNIPNFMYDPDFEEKVNYSNFLKEKNELKAKIEKQEQYTEDLLEELETKDIELEQVAYISDIFIRHHKNASRLVRSLVQLMNEGSSNWKWEFCNNVLDECVTILLEDRADKSSTIYFVENDELEMFAYNRIEYSSARGRVFKKGEGFAGHIWETGETELVSDVTNSPYFQGDYSPKHEYGSILGVPIKIGKDIVGVLCVQSEDIEEFQEDDKVTVVFYADMCALAHFYDKIKVSKGE